MSTSLPVRGLALLSILLLASPAASSDGSLEGVPVRSASMLLQKELVKGRHHEVRDEVRTHGFLHHYAIDSDYGEFAAEGDTAARILIHEIGAIARLQAVSKLDRFGEGIEKAITNPIFAFVSFLDDPADTITGVPKGVGRYFSRLGGMVTGKRGELEEGYAKELVGFAKTKRQVAHRLAVNPYSSNAILQKELNRTSWTIWAGGIAISALFGAGNEPYINTYMAAGIPRTLNQLLLEETPEDLQKRNRASLGKIGAAEAQIEAFLYNPVFSPSHETAITFALERLEGVAGQLKALEMVSELTQDEADARAYQQQFAMFAEYHKTVEALTELFVLRQVIAARTAKARVAVVLPLDEVFWNAAVRDAADEVSSQYQNVEFAVLGGFTDRALAELMSRGIATRPGLTPGE